MRVEIVLDVPCVWSYFGFTRFERAAARFRAAGGDLEVAFLPYQLAPGATAEGELKVDVLRRSFGDDVDKAIAGITAKAVEEGLEFHHERAIYSNTFEAHRLIALASAQGLGEPMVERLFRAHHTDELNVGDLGVLQKLAAEVGVEWSEDGAETVRAGLDRVRRLGIRGIPVFLVGDGRLHGAQSEEALVEALERSAA
jgi:predicted DsbA family dithiol-disulfide isomerase